MSRFVAAGQVIPSLHGGGGAERSLASLGRYLCRSIDLHIVTSARPGGLRADLVSQVPIHSCRCWRW